MRVSIANTKVNNVEIPVAAVTKYLGMHLDHKLNWRDHTVTKRKQIELKVKKIILATW